MIDLGRRMRGPFGYLARRSHGSQLLTEAFYLMPTIVAGFVWRRMIPAETEDLPKPRTPHLGHGSAPWISYEQQQQQQNRQQPQQHIPMTRQLQPTADLPQVAFNNDHRRTKSNPGPDQEDTTSLTSFKTCPSDPNLLANLLPRQVFDNYEEVSRLRSRDTSVLSGGSEVTLSPSRASKRPSLQSDATPSSSSWARSSGATTPIVHTRPRLRDAEFY